MIISRLKIRDKSPKGLPTFFDKSKNRGLVSKIAI